MVAEANQNPNHSGGLDPEMLESFSMAYGGAGTLTWLDGIDEA